MVGIEGAAIYLSGPECQDGSDPPETAARDFDGDVDDDIDGDVDLNMVATVDARRSQHLVSMATIASSMPKPGIIALE